MRKLILCAVMTLVAVGAWAQDEKNTETVSGPKIVFAENKYDFKDITQGDKVSHTFQFENVGNEPLIISDVLTTCGCTVPQYPKEPIAPGKSGKIDVVFNSRGKQGVQNKVVTIVSNAVNSRARVSLVGNVLPAKSDSGVN
ncbi:DUF1573 domain-containing protein [Fulvivirgaceae bacterium BMA10]|uniref:DUF1573 domain-containing protein n=1 Tax=Splendidivirga corallicola TaxID=3051826 RepID=A0ABT8KW08_9BACT|nr:DUF1573 domain-containing protein [Fulvivirgaceae bacterium BMA10]